MLADAVLSALLNVALLAGIPFLFYSLYHRRRDRSWREIAGRAGLRIGDRRYLLYSVALASVGAFFVQLWRPPLPSLVREGSAWRPFVGLGVGAETVAMAALYGIVKTGFSEEFLFRGLIAGSLSRRLPLPWANLAQASIFLLPHFLILIVMPEMWGIVPLVFFGALIVGWLRMRSGSIVGPWLIHAMLNLTMGLSVAARTP